MVIAVVRAGSAAKLSSVRLRLNASKPEPILDATMLSRVRFSRVGIGLSAVEPNQAGLGPWSGNASSASSANCNVWRAGVDHFADDLNGNGVL